MQSLTPAKPVESIAGLTLAAGQLWESDDGVALIISIRVRFYTNAGSRATTSAQTVVEYSYTRTRGRGRPSGWGTTSPDTFARDFVVGAVLRSSTVQGA